MRGACGKDVVPLVAGVARSVWYMCVENDDVTGLDGKSGTVSWKVEVVDDLIFPVLICRYAGEFVSEILAGIKTPERKKENDNAEGGKQRAR